MKSAFIITSVLIPLFNIIVIAFTVLMGFNPLLAIIPCIVGSVLFAIAGYKTAIEPFLDAYEDLEDTLKAVQKSDQARSEFVYAISQAFQPPVDKLRSCSKELEYFGIAKIENMDNSKEKEKHKYDKYYLEPLKKGEEDKSQIIDPSRYKSEIIKEKLLDLKNSTEKISNLTKDIVLFSDISTKTHVTQSGNVNIEKGIDEALEALNADIARREVNIDIELEDGLNVEGVQERFVSMMKKIIENAVLYSHKGGHIYITADNVNGYIFVNVKDEGIGIPQDEINRIFELFYRVQRLDDTNPNGAGMGLAIVKHMAALMDAEIRVKSAVGAGSTFSVIFKRGLTGE